ncbi:GerAB/ArcD/ProY family transporter [Candidatus Woesearchaeota archaeon]|jgi:tyrosine-specific transport protein|nr:GerAB/ArcD/ProY family transporter [Candidatus Woesearchaeota archaeon]MBT4368870.1 GerAB/ArcD/ProY family transporter [Candidatus Woesearchaeota archaeon]MBT4712159.1 GerAB/ArcD/ProY family transporter [Candidatus Woesearchaeota archaeon]MBT6639093.1 GerAB/ArcD/ProY family transporter [Candidatus Woesearchaeota archaeon]MBT7134293.1 GerAB/ArcD/ProY family transporter [Candidatus Woesearchaeota archaeon]
MKESIAIATLIGTIVGAGVLGIPYVIAKAGIVAGIIDLVGIGLLLLVLNLYVGEVALRTKGNHQLTGYAEKYVGKKGKVILMIAMMIEIYGALIAYTMGEGTSLASLFGGNPFLWSLAFFVIGSYLLHRGLKSVGKTELILVVVLTLAVIIVALMAIPFVKLQNLGAGSGNLFLPYGMILFAYLGLTSIPLLKEQLTKHKKSVKKAIIWGSAIPILIYVLFALMTVGVVGITGFNSLGADERIASSALNVFVNGPIGIIVNLFAIAAMGTSFLALGMAMKEMYKYDYKMSKKKAFLLTISVPLIVFLLDQVFDVTNFIQLLGITGAIAGGLVGGMVVIMFHRAKKLGKRKPEYQMKIHWVLSIILMTVFVAGIGYVIINLF